MDNQFCTCENPILEDITEAEQYGGNVRENVIGKWCRQCEKEYIKQGKDEFYAEDSE